MGYIWSPPGGGLEFGESAEEALIREFKEETGLTVDIDRFLFVNEYLDDRFHAIELFFDVKMLSGEVYLGTDPEVPWEEQILTEYKFFSFSELNDVHKGQKHNIFSQCNSLNELRSLRGFYNFINI
jgi:8-oxo-dGTP diphosphatase